MSQLTGALPTIQISSLPQLCSVGPRPQVLTAIFVQWLASHYKSLANIEHKSLQGYVWRPDIKTTGIYIATHTQYDPEAAGNRPALLVKRNGWKSQRLGIDNRMMGQLLSSGNEFYANYWLGSHTIFCLAGTGAEAEILAAETFRELNEFGPVLRPRIGLHRLETVEVGEVYTLEESREHYAVPVNVAYAWEESWQLQSLDTSILNTLDLSLFHP